MRPDVTQVPCLQGPISSSVTRGGGGGGASSTVVICGPGYGHRTAHTAPHFPSLRRGRPRARYQKNVFRAPIVYRLPVTSRYWMVHHHWINRWTYPLCPEIIDEDDMDTVCATTDTPAPIVRPPPGFRQFSWPREEWNMGGEPSLLTLLRSSLACSPGDMGDSRLIRRRCRCRLSFRVA